MKLSHFHVAVRDLANTIEWLARVLDIRPTYQNDELAEAPFGGLVVVFDKAEEDVPITIAFDSDDCDEDYQRLLRKGAGSLEAPVDRPRGVRAAYLWGPGAMKLEIEQPLATANQE